MHTNQKSPVILISILTIFLFLNLNVYLPGSGLFPLPAYIIDLSILIFVIGYYIKYNINLPIGNVFLIWLIYYLALNTIYFIFSPMTIEETSLFKVIIFSIFLYLYMLFLFALDNEDLRTTRKTIVFIAPIASLSLGIDYFSPGFFNLLDSYQVIQGRGASFYRNANYAGISMVILLILGIDMIEKKYRTLFILTIFIGIFFTMSRSNLMTMFLIVFIMFLQKKLYTRHLIITVSIITLFFTWLATGGLDTISQKYDIEITENMKSRVNFFADNAASDTSDMNERKEILHDALEIFTDNPIFGKGLGSTIFWHHPVGPHNTFAMLWAEQGIFGFILLPLLFFVSTINIFKYGKQEHKQLAVLSIVTYTVGCFFSHDILSAVTVIALMAIVSTIGHKMKKLHLKATHEK